MMHGGHSVPGGLTPGGVSGNAMILLPRCFGTSSVSIVRPRSFILRSPPFSLVLEAKLAGMTFVVLEIVAILLVCALRAFAPVASIVQRS